MRGKGNRVTGCRCRPMSARRSSAYLQPVAPAATRRIGRCSSAVTAPHRALTSQRGDQGGGAARHAGPGWARSDAHRLRHTAATAMLRAGASLTEIGQVLRHRARADHRDLREGRPRRAARAGPALAEEARHDRARCATALAGLPDVAPRAGVQARPRTRSCWASSSATSTRQHATRITVEHALAWATLPQRGGRLAARCGCRWCAASPPTCTRLDPADRGPAGGPVRPGTRPRRPRTCTPTPRSPRCCRRPPGCAARLRAATYQTLIGLLAVTGMRVGEAIGARRRRLRPRARRLLTVRGRQVRQAPPGAAAPQHRRRAARLPATCAIGCIRDRGSTGAVRLHRRHPAAHSNVSATFAELAAPGRAGAAARRRAGPASTTCDIPSRSPPCWTGTATAATSPPVLPLLSTYLGHADPAHLLVPVRRPGADRTGRATPRRAPGR